VEISDVAEREAAPAISLCGLLFIAIVVEALAIGLEVDHACDVGGQLISVIVKNVHPHASDGPAYRSWLLQPPPRLGNGGRALCPAVRFPNHRSPPVHHLLLDVSWTRRSRMHDRAQAAEVVIGSRRFRKSQ